MENFSDFLQWLTAGGSVIVTAWFASWLLEDFVSWQQLHSQVKKLIILFVALIIGIGAQILMQNPHIHTTIRPYLDSAVLIIIAWVATQVAHKADTKRSSSNPGR